MILDAFRGLAADAFASFYGSGIVWAKNAALATNLDSLVSAWKGILASIQEVTSGDWERCMLRPRRQRRIT